MPTLIGKESKKKELIAQLPAIYENLSRVHRISIGDFPPVEKMREILASQDFKSFSNLQPKLIAGVEKMLSTDIAKLMQMIPQVSFLLSVRFVLLGFSHALNVKL